jgi:RNA polymerase sigma factor for flagellar operon FliA
MWGQSSWWGGATGFMRHRGEIMGADIENEEQLAWSATKDRQAAIEQYLPLVKYVIGRMSVKDMPGVLDREDLLSYGTIGLIEAVDRFVSSRGVKFETYAITRIRGAIIDGIRAADRLSRGVRQKTRHVELTRSGLVTELGRNPTEQELIAATGLTGTQYQETLAASGRVTISLDAMISTDESGEPQGGGPILADPDDEDFSARLEEQELIVVLTEAVKALPPRELLVVSLRYFEGMTFKEIAQVLDVSESRTCQLHKRAIDRLQLRLVSERAA